MERSEQRQLLRETLARFEISLTDPMCDQFLKYYDLLTEKNQVMNLTAITEYEDVLVRHFLDSLALLYYLPPLRENERVMDLGTGAGFPGIPLKIVCPSISVVLADSLQKRIRFLEEVIDTCDLEKITAVHGRAEELGRDAHFREQFDLCVSRAVAKLSVLSEYCMPFVRTGGLFVSYKAGDVEEEVREGKAAIRQLGGSIEDIHSFTLPGTEISRSLIVIRKTKETPGRFPRKAGSPSKQPIGSAVIRKE